MTEPWQDHVANFVGKDFNSFACACRATRCCSHWSRYVVEADMCVSFRCSICNGDIIGQIYAHEHCARSDTCSLENCIIYRFTHSLTQREDLYVLCDSVVVCSLCAQEPKSTDELFDLLDYLNDELHYDYSEADVAGTRHGW